MTEQNILEKRKSFWAYQHIPSATKISSKTLNKIRTLLHFQQHVIYFKLQLIYIRSEESQQGGQFEALFHRFRTKVHRIRAPVPPFSAVVLRQELCSFNDGTKGLCCEQVSSYTWSNDTMNGLSVPRGYSSILCRYPFFSFCYKGSRKKNQYQLLNPWTLPWDHGRINWNLTDLPSICLSGEKSYAALFCRLLTLKSPSKSPCKTDRFEHPSIHHTIKG